MPQDILRTLDELDGLAAIMETPEEQFNSGYSENRHKYSSSLMDEYKTISSALRRAMSVIDGLREMEIAPLCEDRLSKCACTDGHEAQAHFLDEFDQERDRLLRENGFER